MKENNMNRMDRLFFDPVEIKIVEIAPQSRILQESPDSNDTSTFGEAGKASSSIPI